MSNENNQKPLAASCEACNGCQYQHFESEGWCYMFRDRPAVLPCNQHDRFAAQRQAMGSLVRKRPELLALMIMGASN